MSLEERLRALQDSAAVLQPDAERRSLDLQAVGQHAENFISGLQSQPVYQAPPDIDVALEAMAISTEPAPLSEALAVITDHVDNVGHNLGSSRFFAYIPSGGLYESALADYLAAVSNRFSGVGYASPGSTRMEQTLIRWLSDVVGYPESSDGDLTSGGSMAALSAVVTARESFSIKSADSSTRVVYLTSQTHHTFRKALHIAGMGDCVIRKIAMDDGFRMRPDALQQAIAADRESGLLPWFIGASAGTTDVGAVDELDLIADIAEEENLWFHVDAAYGGSFALCPLGKERLSGLGRSDSLILDPHKGFFLPGGLGVLLVRDGKKLFDAYHARGTYMQDMEHDTERSPCDYSPELTRPFRALRFWLPLRMFGSKPFEAALEEKLLLAEYFHKHVAKIDGMEVGPKPDLSIVTFRYVPENGDADEFNEQLVETIRDDGRIFLTSTRLNDEYIIRMAILGYNTHLADIDFALEVIREKINELVAG